MMKFFECRLFPVSIVLTLSLGLAIEPAVFAANPVRTAQALAPAQLQQQLIQHFVDRMNLGSLAKGELKAAFGMEASPAAMAARFDEDGRLAMAGFAPKGDAPAQVYRFDYDLGGQIVAVHARGWHIDVQKEQEGIQEQVGRHFQEKGGFQQVASLMQGNPVLAAIEGNQIFGKISPEVQLLQAKFASLQRAAGYASQTKKSGRSIADLTGNEIVGGWIMLITLVVIVVGAIVLGLLFPWMGITLVGTLSVLAIAEVIEAIAIPIFAQA